MTHKNILLPLILASLVFTAINTAIASPTDEIATLEQAGNRNEALGFFGGAIVGGLVAGPPGAIGAAMLGLISSSTKSAQDEKQLLAKHLNQSQQELVALQSQQRDLERRYQLAMQEIENSHLQSVSLNNQISSMQDTSACCNDTALSMHFRTNSTAIEQHYMEALEELALSANDIENSIVIVNGYADERGTSADNQRLSEGRVESVVRALMTLGISPDNIHSSAFGESRTLGQSDNLETLFFDRRVNIELRSASNELFTLSE
jgi:sortase system peptidoglycan-associated protein